MNGDIHFISELPRQGSRKKRWVAQSLHVKRLYATSKDSHSTAFSGLPGPIGCLGYNTTRGAGVAQAILTPKSIDALLHCQNCYKMVGNIQPAHSVAKVAIVAAAVS